MSNAKQKGKRKESAKYAAAGRRDRNKKGRIARDAARAMPMPCGHGSRHRSPYDDRRQRCFGGES